MADADDFPGLYYPNDEGNFAWDSPCWNDDWEHNLRYSGYKTVEEWNEVGRIIKNGEEGRYLPCAKIRVFSKSQTTASDFFKSENNSELITDKYFETSDKAIAWAKKNPGRVITRSPDGNGFIAEK